MKTIKPDLADLGETLLLYRLEIMESDSSHSVYYDAVNDKKRVLKAAKSQHDAYPDLRITVYEEDWPELTQAAYDKFINSGEDEGFGTEFSKKTGLAHNSICILSLLPKEQDSPELITSERAHELAKREGIPFREAYKRVSHVLKEETWLQDMNAEGVTFTSFYNAPDELKSNKEFMLRLIKISPLCFQYASKELRDDDELAETALEGWPNQFTHASKRIQSSQYFQDIYVATQSEMKGGLGAERARHYLKYYLASPECDICGRRLKIPNIPFEIGSSQDKSSYKALQEKQAEGPFTCHDCER